MRSVGVLISTLILYVVFVAASASLLIGALIAFGQAVLWSGLAFPVGLREATQLTGGAIVGYGLGSLLYLGLRRLFPAYSPSH